MQTPTGSPEWLRAFTAEERPELWEQSETKHLFRDVWPEYNHHGNAAAHYFGTLVPQHAHLQVLFVDQRSDGPVARARTIPFRWDGTLDDLPAGIDALGFQAVDDQAAPTSLSALAAEIDTKYQGSGLSSLLLKAMAAVARKAVLAPLVAPVRPSWKDRHPLVPIEEYAQWTRDDGLPFDPWLRVHARLGAQMLRPERHSMRITAPVHDWEEWTNTSFPADAEFVFPGGLAPLAITADIGDYWEPNVWMVHET